MSDQSIALGNLAVEVRLQERPYRRVLLLMALSRMRYILPIMFFFMCGALGARDVSWALFLAAAVALLVLITWGYVEWQVKSPAMSEIYLPVKYRFDAEGLIYTTSEGEGIVEWGGFARWRVVGDHYILQARGARFLLLPTAAFTDAERLELEPFLVDKIAKSPRVLPSVAEDIASRMHDSRR